MQAQPSSSSRLRGNHMYGYCDGALAADQLAAVAREVVAADRLGPHQLSRAFGGARGYSLVFTRDGIGAALAALPGLAPYLGLALRPSCNAFYLNPLVIDDGGAVDAHVDCSITPLVGERVCPLLVSVLYVEVPALRPGEGELVLTEVAEDGGARSVRVVPRSNRLVLFRGDLQHEVTRGTAGARRASLVCEQYRLPAEQLARIPTFTSSHGGTSHA